MRQGPGREGAWLKRPRSAGDLRAALKTAYKSSPFIQVLEQGLPETRHVRGTNRCAIGVAVNGRTAILVSAIDNLVKGAVGQAVQAFNASHRQSPLTGLRLPPGAP